jgi:hypothetical protein
MDEMKKDFQKAFVLYWYHKKPIHRRLIDSMSDEEKVCALFFETLNEHGMLDKLYPINKIKKK